MWILCLACANHSGSQPRQDAIAPSKPTTQRPVIVQEVLFEISRVNYATAYTLKGLVVNREGNVCEYDHSDQRWNYSFMQPLDEKFLLEKHERGKKQVGKIEQTILYRQYDLIADAAGGEISQAKDSGVRDYGAKVYLAYQYDRETGRYQPILLLQEGDLVRENASPSAHELVSWLKELERKIRPTPGAAEQ